jgi:hypothetical protein
MHKAYNQKAKLELVTGVTHPWSELRYFTITFSAPTIIADIQCYTGIDTAPPTNNAPGGWAKFCAFDTVYGGKSSIGSKRYFQWQVYGSCMHLLDLNSFAFDAGTYEILVPTNTPYAFLHLLELDNSAK